MSSIKFRPISSNKCYVTEQDAQTCPTLHQTLVLKILGEMFGGGIDVEQCV